MKSIADLIKEFPSLSHLDYSYWKFLAVVGAAWQATRHDCKGKIIFALNQSLVKELEAWDERWIVGFDNISTFRFGDITNLLPDEREQHIEDVLGMWVLWNLHNRAPTYDETDSGRVLGGLLSHIGKEWRQG